ncbi:MAG: hypothetical protein R2827_03000 [Bdellovibrionales bacterium]
MGLSFYRPVIESDHFRLPTIITLYGLNVCQAWAYLHYEAMPYILPYTTVMFSFLILRLNLFWSLALTVFTMASQWIFIYEAGREFSSHFSGIFVTLFAIGAIRFGSRSDIENFISDKKRTEAEQALLEKSWN